MQKVYVSVICKCDKEGVTLPIRICWDDGRSWNIKRVLHACTAAHHEFEGIRYTVNLTDPNIANSYTGEVTIDRYGRKIPKAAHGTANLDRQSSSTKKIVEAVMTLFDRIMNPKLLVRRIYLTANHVVPECEAAGQPETEQLDLFTNYAAEQEKRQREAADLEREKRMQHAMLQIQEKYGKNAILKGTNLQEGATTIQRNGQIGGHKA